MVPRDIARIGEAPGALSEVSIELLVADVARAVGIDLIKEQGCSSHSFWSKAHASDHLANIFTCERSSTISVPLVEEVEHPLRGPYQSVA